MTDFPADKLATMVATSTLSGSDLVKVWSGKYGGDVAASLALLTQYFTGGLSLDPLTAQYEAPTATGFSVTISSGNVWLVLTPTAGFAAGSILLPIGAQGEEVLVNSTEAITALTITPSSGDTVIGGPSSMAANDYFRLKYDSTLSRWYRVG